MESQAKRPPCSNRDNGDGVNGLPSEIEDRVSRPLEWTPEHVQRFWNYWSSRPDQHYHYFARQVGKGVCKFIENLGSVSGQNVLDYGAGPGYLIEQLLQRGAQVSAIEYSDQGVGDLNLRFNRERFWSGAKLFDGKRLPWDDNQFDLVCCLETIEHLLPEDLNVVLRELMRVLRPGGTALLTTPNSENLRAQTVFCPECSSEFHRWQHVRSWNPESLSSHLTKLGYEVSFCDGISFHEFQPARFAIRDVSRIRFWKRVVSGISQSVMDHLRPLPFPRGRRFTSRIQRGGRHHLVAVASKPAASDIVRPSGQEQRLPKRPDDVRRKATSAA